MFKKLMGSLILCAILVISVNVGNADSVEKFEYKIAKHYQSGTIEIQTTKNWGMKTPLRRRGCSDVEILQLLYNIDGISTIYLFNYEISLEIGKMFELDKIEKEIVKVIESYFNGRQYKKCCKCWCCNKNLSD